MKLYILRPIDSSAKDARGQKYWSWDCAYGFTVRAESESHARSLVANAKLSDDWTDHTPGDEGAGVWENPSLTSCVEVPLDGEAAILMRDFLAG